MVRTIAFLSPKLCILFYLQLKSNAAPLDQSFFIAFADSRSDAYVNFVRSNPAAIDIDIVQRLSSVPSTSSSGEGSRPTLYYDGPTHQQYLKPSRNWEAWYCRKSGPFYSSHTCKFLTRNLFNPLRHHIKTEVRTNTIKGRSLHAAEDILSGEFILVDYDNVFSIHIDELEWRELLQFVDDFPTATMYRNLRDYINAYGFEMHSMGVTGWSVSLACNNTFTNHACGEDAINLRACSFDDDLEVAFSPVVARRPRMAAMSACAAKDVAGGDELLQNYYVLRTDPEDHPFFMKLLHDLCDSGVGLVPVDGKTEDVSEL